MPLELKQHFVAFLDVLGFSDMVQSDIAGNRSSYLNKLFKCHQAAATIFADEPRCTVTQFSDSVVIAVPYDPKLFDWFAKSIGTYQRMLLDEGLTCRGGIAVNKHFSNDSFTFSAGLIDAYRVESQLARYPRVVVSLDVISLVFPDIDQNAVPSSLVQEDDGIYFIDYLGITKARRPVTLRRALQGVVGEMLASPKPSVKEKGRWLAAYSDAVLDTKFGVPRFRGRALA